MDLTPLLDRAADAIRSAEGLIIAAGAGMGVDSGLPDFRGPEGFWRAYPAYRKLGVRFEEMANPRWFVKDPALAWGFYGHRMMLYRNTVPHAGFGLLRAWASRKRHGAFVFTSNVDSQFQKAGFPEDRVLECHGTLATLQCMDACGAGIFSAAPFEVDVDPETFRARGAEGDVGGRSAGLPACPRCGALARPNVLMFGDLGWDATLADAQQARFEAWIAGAMSGPLAIVELGAGTGVPTVRAFSERTSRVTGSPLVRINVREPEGGTIGLPMGALAALTEIEARIGG